MSDYVIQGAGVILLLLGVIGVRWGARIAHRRRTRREAFALRQRLEREHRLEALVRPPTREWPRRPFRAADVTRRNGQGAA